MTAGLIAALAALAVATAIGLAYHARNGRLSARGKAPATASATGREADRAPAAAGLTAEEIGGPLGSRATLLQFSSAFCALCRATRLILADAAQRVGGVTHIEVDAESRLDLVRRLNVRRTPTTFVLGPGGEITHKASGQPRQAEVLAALWSQPAG